MKQKQQATLLNIENLTKHFGGIHAVENVSLSIPTGTIVALIGPNGSGKSTLFNLISHIHQKDHGSIYLNNEEITAKKDYEVARLGISRTFQDVRLFQNLTIQDHLAIALSETDEHLLHSLFTKERNNKNKIKDILTLVGLNKARDTFATELSYGQRKLLDLAIAIAKPHKILLLDEPVAGINPELRQRIKHILQQLHTNKETILIIEHDMNFIMDLAHYIYVLDNGTLIAEGKPKEIQKNKTVLEAYLGE